MGHAGRNSPLRHSAVRPGASRRPCGLLLRAGGGGRAHHVGLRLDRVDVDADVAPVGGAPDADAARHRQVAGAERGRVQLRGGRGGGLLVAAWKRGKGSKDCVRGRCWLSNK